MKEIIRMNQLAGLITEGQAKKMMAVADKKAALKNKRSLKENESSDLTVKWTKVYLDNENKDPYFYTEKGLADGFEMIKGQKVKEIVGYFEDEDGDEDYDIIGYIYSKGKKDIETDYNEDDLNDIFINSLSSMKESSKNSLKENESSAYITIDPEYPTEVELYADSGDYAGEIEKNGKVTFTLTFDEGDSEGTYMNSEDIFDDYAPKVFKMIVKAGGDFDAGDDYVEVTTTLDNLKKLFPMK